MNYPETDQHTTKPSHLTGKQSGTHLTFKQLVVLSGFYFYAFIFFNRLFFFPLGESRFHPICIQAALAVAGAAFLLAMRVLPHMPAFLPRKHACLLTGTSFVGGMAVDFIGLHFPALSPEIFQAIACMLFCFGMVTYSLIWASVYERLSFTAMMEALVGSFLASVVIRILSYVNIYGQIIPLLALAALLTLSLFMANRSTRMPSLTFEIDINKSLPHQRIDKGFLTTIWGPLAATFAIAFGTGLTWGESASYSYDVTLALVAALVTTLVILFFINLEGDNTKSRSLFFEIVFPLSTLLLLASLFLGGEVTAPVAQIFDFLYYIALSLFEVCILAALIAVSQANGTSVVSAILLKYVTYGIAFIMGKALFLAVGATMAPTAIGIVLMAYLALNIVMMAKNRMGEPKQASVHEMLSHETGMRYGLTPREEEVLSCLLEGRTYEGVGRTLFISASTVKTHVKHIYGKAGVQTRDELIEKLLDAD